uniref:Uncharacterized protein n=1 Tax=Arundo donax TaxID=35708 RepID=A0A0A8YFF3_ARUDO
MHPIAIPVEFSSPTLSFSLLISLGQTFSSLHGSACPSNPLPSPPPLPAMPGPTSPPTTTLPNHLCRRSPAHQARSSNPAPNVYSLHN